MIWYVAAKKKNVILEACYFMSSICHIKEFHGCYPTEDNAPPRSQVPSVGYLPSIWVPQRPQTLQAIDELFVWFGRMVGLPCVALIVVELAPYTFWLSIRSHILLLDNKTFPN